VTVLQRMRLLALGLGLLIGALIVLVGVLLGY
jgi:hypothetical protein